MRVILVIGPNRSGSSCIAGVLHHLGVDMGYGAQMSNGSNTKGFYEDLKYKSIFGLEGKRRRVEALSFWSSKRISEGLKIWGLKHPSLCDFGWSNEVIKILNSKEEIKDNIRMIFCDRDFTSMVASCCTNFPKSLKGEDKYDVDLTTKVWEHNTNKSLGGIEKIYRANKYKKTKVKYENLINSSATENVVNYLAAFCYGGLEARIDDRQIKQAVDFVDPNMRHF